MTFTDDQKAVIKELVRVAEPYLMHQTTVAIAPLIDEIIRLRGLVASPVCNDDIGRVLHEQVQNLIHPIAPLPFTGRGVRVDGDSVVQFPVEFYGHFMPNEETKDAK